MGCYKYDFSRIQMEVWDNLICSEQGHKEGFCEFKAEFSAPNPPLPKGVIS
jgi:hypothetical protein